MGGGMKKMRQRDELVFDKKKLNPDSVRPLCEIPKGFPYVADLCPSRWALADDVRREEIKKSLSPNFVSFPRDYTPSANHHASVLLPRLCEDQNRRFTRLSRFGGAGSADSLRRSRWEGTRGGVAVGVASEWRRRSEAAVKWRR